MTKPAQHARSKRLYKNRREPRKIPLLRATWYYIKQLADQMGMTPEAYAEFALRNHVHSHHKMLTFDRQWADSSKERQKP